MEDAKILEILFSWKTYLKQKNLIKREIQTKIIKSMGKEVIDIIGIRRSGKSSLLNLLIKQLDLKDSLILYVNFDDPMFANFLDLNLLEKIWDVYRININPDEKPFIFFDEIQVIPKWEKWVKKIRDLEIAHVFITGSSSKLLSREYGTSLTGRHITQVLFPLSFKEFLRFKNFKIPKNKADIYNKKIWLRKHFQEFLINGGFPEFVLSENIELLKNYFEDILYKDVIIRHQIRDVNLLRKIANYCLTNISQSLSYNSLKNLFKISLDTARAYLSYIEESFMIFQVSIFSYSLKIQEVNPKKVYCIDNGLRNAISFKFSKDEGKLAENLIFIELKRRGKEIYYWKGKNEVDFIVKEIDDSLKALNITYTDEITKREIEGLKEFKEKFSSQVTKLIILTKNIEKKKNGIVYIPIWKWLLSSEDIV